MRGLPRVAGAFSAAQAAWRFYHNESVPLPVLAEPILAAAREACLEHSDRFALVMHDFSGLHYTHHASKGDRVGLYGKDDPGYFLQSALLVCDRDGSPLAPLYIGIDAADGIHSTRRRGRLPRRRQLSELSRAAGHIEGLGLGREAVHIVDRQADSVLHLRRFVRLGRSFVIRSNDIRRVSLEGGGNCRLTEIEERVRPVMRKAGRVEHRGKPAEQYVAEVRVRLAGPAKQRGRGKTHREERKLTPGKPIQLRLVISEVRDPKTGKVLAVWRLWTNLGSGVAAEEIARWYYWRWRIESFFKLLKRGGQHLEQWQQESAEALARRLLIASQALVIVWALMRAGDEAKPLRQFLVQLSGRLVKRKVEYTAPALLAGMLQFLAVLEALEKHTTAELIELGQTFLRILGLESELKNVKELV